MSDETILDRRAPAAALTVLLFGVLILTLGPRASGYGELTVRPTTSGAAQITVDGVARNATAIEGLPLAAGAHELCFAASSGYVAPPCETVQILNDQTTTVTPDFVPAGELQVTTAPVQPAAQIAVDGVPRDGGEVRFPVAVGRYEVCFGDVAGMSSPPCEVVEVVAGQTVEVVGRYTEFAPDTAGSESLARGPVEPQPEPGTPTRTDN